MDADPQALEGALHLLQEVHRTHGAIREFTSSLLGGNFFGCDVELSGTVQTSVQGEGSAVWVESSHQFALLDPKVDEFHEVVIKCGIMVGVDGCACRASIGAYLDRDIKGLSFGAHMLLERSVEEVGFREAIDTFRGYGDLLCRSSELLSILYVD